MKEEKYLRLKGKELRFRAEKEHEKKKKALINTLYEKGLSTKKLVNSCNLFHKNQNKITIIN